MILPSPLHSTPSTIHCSLQSGMRPTQACPSGRLPLWLWLSQGAHSLCLSCQSPAQRSTPAFAGLAGILQHRHICWTMKHTLQAHYMHDCARHCMCSISAPVHSLYDSGEHVVRCHNPQGTALSLIQRYFFSSKYFLPPGFPPQCRLSTGVAK